MSSNYLYPQFTDVQNKVFEVNEFQSRFRKDYLIPAAFYPGLFLTEPPLVPNTKAIEHFFPLEVGLFSFLVGKFVLCNMACLGGARDPVENKISMVPALIKSIFLKGGL